MTRDDYRQLLEANVDYESDLSGTKAALFVKACRMLRVLTPSSSAAAQGGLIRFETSYSIGELQAMENQAQRWLASLTESSAATLLGKAKVARQFGLNRLRYPNAPTDPSWGYY